MNGMEMNSQNSQILDIEDWPSLIAKCTTSRCTIDWFLANKLSVLQESLFSKPLGIKAQLLVNKGVVDHEQSLRILSAYKLIHIKLFQSFFFLYSCFLQILEIQFFQELSVGQFVLDQTVSEVKVACIIVVNDHLI